MTSELHTPLTLADLIDKELIGVDPDSQLIVLDDTDWRLITTALRRVTPEFTRCVSCDGYNCDDGCAYPDTRAVPDVPELVRYSRNLIYAGWSDESAQSQDGEYVLHSQAATVIAAKDEALDGLSVVVEECNAEIEELSVENVALKNKLAQIEKQEAAGYAVYDKTGFRNFHTDKPNISPEDLNEYEITIIPLILHPQV